MKREGEREREREREMEQESIAYGGLFDGLLVRLGRKAKVKNPHESLCHLKTDFDC